MKKHEGYSVLADTEDEELLVHITVKNGKFVHELLDEEEIESEKPVKVERIIIND